MQHAFAEHLHHLGDADPKEMFPEVMLTLDSAPLRRGKVNEALFADDPI
jgi:hypothetical protein